MNTGPRHSDPDTGPIDGAEDANEAPGRARQSASLVARGLSRYATGVFGTHSRRDSRWRPPRWYELVTWVILALQLGAVLLKSLADTGDTPLTAAAVVLLAWIAVGWWLWAGRPAEPSEFR